MEFCNHMRNKRLILGAQLLYILLEHVNKFLLQYKVNYINKIISSIMNLCFFFVLINLSTISTRGL